MRSKRLKLDLIQDELVSLERDHKSVAQDLKVELDSPTQNKLRDRLNLIRERMDVLETEAKSLQDELSQAQDLSGFTLLGAILQRHLDEFPAMLAAYRDVLRQRSWPHGQAAKTPEAILTQLIRIPKGESKFSPMTEFGAYLLNVTENINLITDLQDWGQKELGSSWNDLLEQSDQQLQQLQTEQVLSSQPAMLIYIDSDEASPQAEDETYYKVDAWVINDIQHYRDAQQGYRKIVIQDKKNETFARSVLSEELPKLFCQFLTEGSQLLDQEPILHIFVPLELMNER